MFNLTHNSKKKWLASFALITSVAAVAATINFSDDFSTEDSIDTVKTTANLSTEEQAVYLAWSKQQQHRLPDGGTAGTAISSDTDSTQSIALADIDGDGNIDVVAGNYDQTNKLYLNDGSGGFTTGAGTDIGSELDSTTSIALGDIDGDGDLDLVAGNDSGTNKLYLYDSSTSSFAATGTAIGNFADTWSIALGDIDGDGHLDLVTGNYDQINKLYLNDGSGGFTTGTNIGSDTDDTQSIALADIDSDGDIDVVVGNSGETNKLYLNDGSGGFTTGAGTDIGSDTDNTYAIALADIDSDGHIDVVAGNQDQTNKLYLNNSGGGFTTGAGTDIGSDTDYTFYIALADIDSDGHIDVVAGNRGQTNKLYLNNGNGVFTTDAGTDIGSDTDSTFPIALADIDGDGDIDVVVGNSGDVNKLYLNAGSSGFDATGTGIGSESDTTSSIAVGDIDSDGDLDVVVGNTGANKLYLNDGSGGFTTGAGTAIGSDSDTTYAIALGDIDGDGDLDVVVGNRYENNKAYLNDGSGGFTTGAGTAIGSESDDTISIVLGDIDGDGDLDVVTGNYAETNKLYLNDGSGGFTTGAGTDIGSDADNTLSIALGDIDSDGNLDVVVGNIGANKRYLNDGSGGFTTSTVISSESDETYSIVLGDIDGDGDLDVVAGNNGVNKLNLNDGSGGFDATGTNIGSDSDITWSIALGDIDSDGDLDVVASDADFNNKLYLNDGSGGFTTGAGTAIGSDSDTTYAIALGDIDGDGDIDVVAGNNGETNKLYFNSDSGGFTSGAGTGIGSDTDYTFSIGLADIDGDGDIDVVAGNYGQTNKLYLNDGNGGFTTGTDIGSDTDNTQSITLADIDNDGDLDVVAGNHSQTNKRYLNNGSGGFTSGTGIGSDTDITYGIALVDMDGDGDIDVVAGNEGETNKLYLNDGSGGFTTGAGTDIGSDTDYTQSIALADINSDGDIDVVAGNSSGTNKLYLNDGSGGFTTGTDIGSDTDNTYAIALADIDNDGDLDVVAGNFNLTNKLYLNNGSGGFTSGTGTGIGSDTDRTYAIALADMDGDGDIDVVAGNEGETNKLYLNDGSGGFTSGTGIGSDTDITYGIALVDMDGDGGLDVVAGNNGSNKLYKQISFAIHANAVYSNKVNGSNTEIADVTLTATEITNTATTRNTSIDYYVSNNGGDKWHGVKSGSGFTFPSEGTDDIRWRAQLNSLSPVVTPVLSSIELSYTPSPKITGVAYNIFDGELTVTGVNFDAETGAANDIDASTFTFTGEASGTYTLTDTADVDIASSTEFTLTLSATDKAAVNALINKNGTTSTDATVYNLAAAEDWNVGAKTSLIIADSTTPITASNLTGDSDSEATGLTVGVVATSVSNTSYDMSYVITLTNSGDEVAENVQVTTTIPEGVVLSVVPDNCELTGTLLTCTIASVAAGETVTITLSLTGSENVNDAIVTSIVSADASSEASSVSTTFDSVFKEVTVKAKSSGGSMPIMGLFGCLILLLVRKVKLKSSMMKKLMAAVLVLLATGAQAEDAQSQSFQMSDLSFDLSLGSASSEVSNKSAEQGLANNSQQQNGISTDGSRFAYHAEVGYQVYSDWRVLAGYMDLGPATLTFNGVTSSVEDLIDSLSELDMVSGKGLTASVEYTYQYKAANNYNLENWYLAPQVGLFSWNGEIGVDVGDESHTFKESDISLLYGLTLGYQFNDKASLGLRWLKTSVEQDVNTVMLSFSYSL